MATPSLYKWANYSSFPSRVKNKCVVQWNLSSRTYFVPENFEKGFVRKPNVLCRLRDTWLIIQGWAWKSCQVETWDPKFGQTPETNCSRTKTSKNRGRTKLDNVLFFLNTTKWDNSFLKVSCSVQFQTHQWSSQTLLRLKSTGLDCTYNGYFTHAGFCNISHWAMDNTTHWATQIFKMLTYFIIQYLKIPLVNITTCFIRKVLRCQVHNENKFSKILIFILKVQFYYMQQLGQVPMTGSPYSFLRNVYQIPQT